MNVSKYHRGAELVNTVHKAFSELIDGNSEHHKKVLLLDNLSLKQYYYNTRLDPSILSLDGMSGAMFRNFINNLMAQPQISSYLEIGCWTGSTAISAMYNNNNVQRHWLIDNWSEWGNEGQTEKQFHKNWNAFIKNKSPVLIDKDCFSIVPSEHAMSAVDVCFCDGGIDETGERNSYKILSHYCPAMADQFIFIVDDWYTCTLGGDAGAKLQSQTNQAIKDLGLTVLFNIALPQNNNAVYTDGVGDKYGWWNGCAIFVLSK
jgi:hypothetical protein